MKSPNEIRFLCLCALYNHSQKWVENLVECFVGQSHRNADLVLIDDRDAALREGFTIDARSKWDGVLLLTLPERAPTLMDKYTVAEEGYLYTQLLERDGGIIDEAPNYDAIVVMDDDDFYLPHFLATHAEVLAAGHGWSYPEKIFSTYGNALRVEETGGRFWASAAYGRELFEKIGGFGDSARADFDQDMLKRAFAVEAPGRPQTMQYVYNWELTGDSHVSGLMQGQSDTSWYGKSSQAAAEGPLNPRLCEEYMAVYNEIAQKYPEELVGPSERGGE